MEELLKQKICPRCGEHYTYIEKRKIGNNVYVYCVHVHKHNGKRNIKKCYLGPETAYIYANTFNYKIIMVRSPLADNSADIKYLAELADYFGVDKVIEILKNLKTGGD